MNDDDFESMLRQHPPRPLPGHWRDTILDDATTVPATAERAPGWRGYALLRFCLGTLKRNPAWSGLAGMWMMSLFLHLIAPRIDDGKVAETSGLKPASPQVLVLVWQLRYGRRDDRSAPAPANDAALKQAPADRPRSVLQIRKALV